MAKLGLTVATFFGNEALGRARAFGSNKLDAAGRDDDDDDDDDVGEPSPTPTLPTPLGDVDFFASSASCCGRPHTHTKKNKENKKNSVKLGNSAAKTGQTKETLEKIFQTR